MQFPDHLVSIPQTSSQPVQGKDGTHGRHNVLEDFYNAMIQL
ncbi:hypothetical protein [Limosilactobacillus caecicola]|nr:hypothetical protein [Limosilactobacillus caecicola]